MIFWWRFGRNQSRNQKINNKTQYYWCYFRCLYIFLILKSEKAAGTGFFLKKIMSWSLFGYIFLLTKLNL